VGVALVAMVGSPGVAPLRCGFRLGRLGGRGGGGGYPPRSEQHPALRAFRAWLLDAAAAYARAVRLLQVGLGPGSPRQRRRGGS